MGMRGLPIIFITFRGACGLCFSGLTQTVQIMHACRLRMKMLVDDMPPASAWRNSEYDDIRWIVYVKQEKQVQHRLASRAGVFNSWALSRAQCTYQVNRAMAGSSNYLRLLVAAARQSLQTWHCTHDLRNC